LSEQVIVFFSLPTRHTWNLGEFSEGNEKVLIENHNYEKD